MKKYLSEIFIFIFLAFGAFLIFVHERTIKDETGKKFFNYSQELMFQNRDKFVNALDSKGSIYLRPGLSSFAPYTALQKGYYIVKILGENLEFLTVHSYYNGGNNLLEKLSQSVESNEIDFIIKTDKYIDNYEVFIENTSDETVRIDNIFVLPVDINDVSYTEVLPENTDKIFLYNLEKTLFDWDFENYILKNNISIKEINQNEILNKINNLQSGSIVIMPKNSLTSGYINKQNHYYQLDDDKVVISLTPVKMSDRLIKLNTDDINTLAYDYQFNGQNLKSGYDDAGIRYIEKGGVSFGPDIDVNAGMYIVEFAGENLNSANCKVTVNSGNTLVIPLAQSKDDDRVKYLVYFTDKVKHLETIVENKGNSEVVLNRIVINRYLPKEINPPFELPENINKVIINADRGLDFTDNLIGYIFLHNLKVENITERNFFVKLFKKFDKNALFVLSKLASDDKLYSSLNQYYYTNNNIFALHQTLNPDLRYVQKEKQKKTDKKAQKREDKIDAGVLYSFKYASNLYLKKGKDENGQRHIYPSGQSYGPCIDIKKGNYLISIKGENLDSAKFKVTAERAFVEIPVIYSRVEEDKAFLFVSVNHDETYFEVNIENPSSSDIVLKSLEIRDVKYYNDRRIEGINKVISLDDRVELSNETAKLIVDNNLLYTFDKAVRAENLSSSIFLTNPDNILQYLKYHPYFYKLDYNLLFSTNKIKNLKPEAEAVVYRFDNPEVFGLTNGRIEDGVKYIYKDGKSFGPNITIEKGIYKVEISGDNLNNANYSITSKSGKKHIPVLSQDLSEHSASVFFVLEETSNDFEFVIDNKSDRDIVISDMTINSIMQYGGKNRTVVYIKRDDDNKYYFTKAETDGFIDEKADIRFNNLNEMPGFLRKFYLNSQKENVEFIVPVSDYSTFAKNKIKKYVYNSKYLLLTNRERNDFFEYAPKENKKYLFENNKFLNNGEDIEGVRHIKPSGQSFGPDITMQKGLYKTVITGENLDKAEFSVKSNNGIKSLSILAQKADSEKAEIYFLLEKKEKHYELIIENKSKDEEVILTNIVTKPVKTDGEQIVKIQVNDSNKYYFSTEEIEKFIEEDAEFRFVNLKAIPQYLMKLYLNSQEDNAVFVIPVMDCSNFIKFDMNFFRLNDKYLLMQEDNNSDYPQFKIEKNKKYQFENNKFLNNGEDIEGVRYIKPAGQSFGPDITMQKGLYKAVINGENLDKAEFSVKSNNGKKSLSILSQSVSSEKAEIYFLLEKKEKHYELIIENKSNTEDVVLTGIETNPVPTDGYHVVKIQLNDVNKYYFTNEEIEKFIEENSRFKFVNLNEMPKKLMNYYLKFQSEDVDLIVSVSKIDNFKKSSLAIYEYNKHYYLLSNDNSKGLKKYIVPVKKKYLFENNMFLTNGEDIEGVRHIRPSGQSFGPDITMKKGLYKSVITGENLDKAEFTVKSNNGVKSLSILAQEVSSERAELYFLLEQKEKHYELIIDNKSKDEEVILTNIVTTPVKTENKHIVKIQLNDANKYYFTNEEIEQFVSEGARFKFINLDSIPQMFKKLYFASQKKNTEIVMPKFRHIDFEDVGKNFYVLGDKYLIETKGSKELEKYKDYVYKYEFKGNKNLTGGRDEDGVRYLEPGGKSFGPNNTMKKGLYKIEMEGGNLENALFTLTSNTGTKQIGILSKEVTDGKAVLIFLLEETEKNFEFTTENTGDDEMSLSDVVIKKVEIKKPLKTVKIQVNDANEYHFTNEEMEQYISDAARFKFINLDEIPQWFVPYYFKYQPKTTEIIMPSGRYVDFERYGKNFYILNKTYMIETTGKKDLPKYRDYVFKYEFKDNQDLEGGHDEDGVRYIAPGGKSFGPNNTMQKGIYQIRIKGANLSDALCTLTSNTGTKQIGILSRDDKDGETLLTFLIEETEKYFEIIIENTGSNEISLSELVINNLKPEKTSKLVKIQSDDGNSYYFTNDEIMKYISEGAEFRFINLDEIPQWLRLFYFAFQKKSTEIILPSERYADFENDGKNFYKLDDKYVIETSGRLALSRCRDYVYKYEFKDNQNLNGGYDEDGVRYLEPGGKSFGPDNTMQKGLYKTVIKGKNLKNALYDITSDTGRNQIAILSQKVTEDDAVVTFLIEKTEKMFEFTVENVGDENIVISDMEIKPVIIEKASKKVKIQLNDANEYHFTQDEIDGFIAENAQFTYINLNKLPSFLTGAYLKLSSDDILVITKEQIENFQNYKVNIESLNDFYSVMTVRKPEKKSKDYVYTFEFGNNQNLINGRDENGVRYLDAGGKSFGPDITMAKGLYKVEIKGGNLENASYTITSDLGTKEIGILSRETKDNSAVVTFLLEQKERNFEFIVENKGTDELSLEEVAIKKITIDKPEKTVKIQYNDMYKYYFTDEEIEKFISDKAQLRFINLDAIPDWFRKYYFMLQKKNVEIIIPSERYSDFEIYRVKIEEFNNSYFKITGKKAEKTPKDYVYKFEFKGNKNVSEGHDENGVRYLEPKGRSFGPGITLHKGLYKAEINGGNLENASYSVTSNLGTKPLAILSQETKDERTVITFLTEETENNVEFIVENKGNDELSLSEFVIKRIKNDKPSKTVKIQYDDTNQYNFTDEEIEKFISEKAQLKFINLDAIPQWFRKYYFILQKRSTEIIIPEERYTDYELYRVKIGEFNDSYCVITGKKAERMPKDYVYKYEFKGNKNVSNGYDESGVRYLEPSGRSFGPDITMHKGLYKIEIEGGNLENAVYTITSDLGKKQIGILSQETANSKSELLFLLDRTEKNFEIIVENFGNEDMSLSKMVIKRNKFKKTSKRLNIQVDDENNYYFSKEETDKFISDKAQIKYINLNKIPNWLLKYYFAIQRKNTEFIIPESELVKYEKLDINIYKLDEEYFVLTKGEISSLPKYTFSDKTKKMTFDEGKFLDNGYDSDGVRHLNPSGQSFGPDITLEKGLYKAEITGKNLDKASYSAMSLRGTKQLPILAKDTDGDRAEIWFLLEKRENNFELLTQNDSEDEEVLLTSMEIKEVPYDKRATVKIQQDDNNQYYFTSKSMEHFVAQRADIKFVNLREFPKALLKLYFMFQTPNTEFAVPKKDGKNYEKSHLNFYILDDSYFVMTKGDIKTLTKYLLSDKIKRYSFDEEKFLDNGYDIDGVRHLNPSGQSFGPDITFEKGLYKAEISGKNLDKAEYSVMSEKGSKQLPVLSRETDSDKTEMYFLLEKRENNFELMIENKSEDEEVILTEMVITQEMDNSSLHKIKIQLDDDNKYYFAASSVKSFINQDAEVKFVNINLVPEKLLGLYFRLQPKNCDFVIPINDYSKYQEYKLHTYQLDERYLLITNGKNDELKEYKVLEYNYVFGNDEFLYNGKDENGRRYIYPDGQSTGPDISLEKGYYSVEITGENLLNGDYLLTSDYGNKNIISVSKEVSSDKVKMYFILDKNESHIETVIKNLDEQENIFIDKLVIRPINRVNGNSLLKLADENLKKIVIAKDDENQYYLTSKDMENGILKTKAKVEIVDFNSMFKFWLKYYFKFSGKDVIYIVPKYKQIEFSQYKLHCFDFDENYVVMTKGICAGLKQTESIKYEYVFNDEYLDGGEDIDGERHLPQNAYSFGPNISLGKGLYEVEILGENLDEIIYDTFDTTNPKALKVLARFGDSKQKKIYTTVYKPINKFEVSIENPEETTAIIKSITIKRVPKYAIKPYSAFPYGINKIINYGANLKNVDESLIRSIAYQNIEIEDSDEESYVLDYISKHKNDTLLLINSENRKDIQEKFLQERLYFYSYKGVDFVSFPKFRLLHKYGIKPIQIPFEYNCKFDASSITNGKDEDGRRYLYINGASSGPGIPLKKGYYEVTIQGERIDSTKINMYYSNGGKEIIPYFAKCYNGEIILLLNLDENIDALDIGILNSYIELVVIDSIKIREISKEQYKNYRLQPYYYAVNEVVDANAENDNLTFNLKQGSYDIEIVGNNLTALKSNISKDYYVNDFHVTDYQVIYNRIYFSVDINKDCQMNLMFDNSSDKDAGIYFIRITPKAGKN